MDINNTLKKWKILKKDFAPYAGYDTVKGLSEAMKSKKRQKSLKHSLTIYILEIYGRVDVDMLTDIVKNDNKPKKK